MAELAPMDTQEAIDRYNTQLYNAQKEAGDLRGKMNDIHRFTQELANAVESGDDLEGFYELFEERLADILTLSGGE